MVKTWISLLCCGLKFNNKWNRGFHSCDAATCKMYKSSFKLKWSYFYMVSYQEKKDLSLIRSKSCVISDEKQRQKERKKGKKERKERKKGRTKERKKEWEKESKGTAVEMQVLLKPLIQQHQVPPAHHGCVIMHKILIIIASCQYWSLSLCFRIKQVIKSYNKIAGRVCIILIILLLTAHRWNL